MLSITRRRPKGPTQVLGYKLRKLTFALDHQADMRLQEKFDLTLSQFILLFGAAHYPEASQCAIARFLNLTEAAVSRQIDGLLERKLITREQNPQNRREHILTLTSEGQSLLSLMKAEMESLYQESLGSLSPGELRVFDRVIGKLLLANCHEQASAETKAKEKL